MRMKGYMIRATRPPRYKARLKAQKESYKGVTKTTIIRALTIDLNGILFNPLVIISSALFYKNLS
jgi:hypothetical protein